MNPIASLTAVLRRALPVLLLSLPLALAAAEQRTFATPEAAVDAFAAALKANDERALIEIFGEKHKNLVSTGSPSDDAARRAEFASALATFRLLDDKAPDRRVLLVGDQAWPFPVPVVREGSVWRFAAEQGAEELLNRRVGRNERNALYVLRSYVDAQREYASRDRDGDGVLQYAAKLGSSPGKFDGLYWPANAGKNEEASPFGPLIAQSASYFAGRRLGDAYHGYHFRILTRQGAAAPGGAYNYVINGRLLAGFAMVAWPDIYGESGVMTFIVNHNGKIFERDLGKNTGAVADKMSSFDPRARLAIDDAVTPGLPFPTFPSSRGARMNHPSLIVVAASLVVACGLPVVAQAEDKAVMTSSPGQATIAQKRRLVATVEAIDVAKREITLKGPKGKVVPLSVSPDVRNLEQVKVGDQLAVTYVEALSLTLKKDGKELRAANTKSDSVRAAEGAKPGGAVAEHTKVTADVIAVDRKTHMVTLRGPKQEVDLYVADPAQLKLIKVGDQIEAEYTQALAITVEPAKK